MDPTPEDYRHDADDSSDREWLDHAWLHDERAEATRRWQALRQLTIAVADVHLGLARAYAKHGRHTRRACGLLAVAAERYQAAGLTRRGRVAWRLAQWLHATHGRGQR